MIKSLHEQQRELDEFKFELAAREEYERNMRLDSKDIPDHIKRLMPQEARPTPAIPLPEQFALHAEQSEKELQSEIVRQLNDRCLAYEWKSMVKKNTGTVGCPDFIVCLPKGVFLAIECKVGKNDLSEKQNEFRNQVELNGGLWMTVWDAEPVRQILRAHCL